MSNCSAVGMQNIYRNDIVKKDIKFANKNDTNSLSISTLYLPLMYDVSIQTPASRSRKMQRKEEEKKAENSRSQLGR